MASVALTGATGLIGRSVVRALQQRGDEVTVLSRNASQAQALLGDVEAVPWERPELQPCPAQALAGRDAVIHLLGEPVAQRWNDGVRRAIRESRVLGTRNLVGALATVDSPPDVLISQSATGWYGQRGSEAVDETEHHPGSDFLAEVVAEWESEALRAADLGVRVALPRTGVVLSAEGGALEKMLPAFKLGLGGPVAGGRQYVPWVALADVVGALLLCLDTPAALGAVNVTAPVPVTNGELARSLGRVLRRPALLPVPAAALRLLYGDMASIITTGARVIPTRLQALGYSFGQPELEGALRAVLAG